MTTRLERYEAIEKHRGRPLVVYATSTRDGVEAHIAGDAVREFIDQIDAIPKEQRKLDVLIHSAGGDPLAAWKIMSVLRERFDEVSVLVPYMAFSAATLFSLGANEIVMHPHASLGPIDPQITMKRPDGKSRKFSYEDVGAFLRFLKSEVGLTEQSYVATIVDKLFAAVDPLDVGFAQRASELSTDVGERLLKLHMSSENGAKTSDARSIAERLNKAFFAHGDAVSRRRARELGLKVAKDDPVLESLVWDAYLAIEDEMTLRSPFNPIALFLADAKAAATLASPSSLQLPPNTPPPFVQNAWNAVLQNAVTNASQGGTPEVPYEVIVAVVESARKQRSFRHGGSISAFRVGPEIKVAITAKKSGWGDS
jgi:hypothetical protein